MTTDSARGELIATLGSADSKGVVRIDDRYNASVDEVWSALTTPDRLARWYGAVEGDLRVGGEFRLHIEADGWYGTGRVDACEAPHRLVVTDRETDESYQAGIGAEPFDATIEATLTADGDGTRLVLQVGGLPLDKLAYYGAGWQIHAEHLADHLAERESGDTEARWAVLVPPYLELAAGLG